jgi:ketosteroid isomerase-like protein
MPSSIRALCCLLAIMITSPMAASAIAGQTPGTRVQKPVRSDQETLTELEREWNAAFHRNDVRTVERILADEFIATYSDGSRGDKAKELKLAAEFNQQIDSSLLDDFTIRIYGDTAVVWFTLHLTGPKNGRPTQVTYRYVDVFVMRDDRWQCVSSQSTRVPAQQP